MLDLNLFRNKAYRNLNFMVTYDDLVIFKLE